MFFSSKLDPPVIKTLERIRFSTNKNIGEGESNFDEKSQRIVQLIGGSFGKEILLIK